MNREMIEKNLVVKLSFEFSLLVIEYCDKLEVARKFVVARQLLRSGTAICANIIEAQNSESRADFVHKFKIAAKESEETQYWLLLCKHSKNYPECQELLAKIASLNKVIGKIISTIKSRSKT